MVTIGIDVKVVDCVGKAVAAEATGETERSAGSIRSSETQAIVERLARNIHNTEVIRRIEFA